MKIYTSTSFYDTVRGVFLPDEVLEDITEEVSHLKTPGGLWDEDSIKNHVGSYYYGVYYPKIDALVFLVTNYVEKIKVYNPQAGEIVG